MRIYVVLVLIGFLGGCGIDEGGSVTPVDAGGVSEAVVETVSVHIDCRHEVEDLFVLIEIWDSAGWLYISEVWPTRDTTWTGEFVSVVRGRCAWSGYVSGLECWDDCDLVFPADTVVLDTVPYCHQE